MHELLVEVIGLIVPWVEAVGIAVVLWGAVEGLFLLARRGVQALRGVSPLSALGHIRVALGEKMALGLDFFLAGDIIQTIVVPTWESLAILGGIVVIRTVIAFFLGRDLKELRD